MKQERIGFAHAPEVERQIGNQGRVQRLVSRRTLERRK